jgi:hypothetical protein
MVKQDMNDEEIEYLEHKIKEAEEKGESIEPYIIQEIDWLRKQLRMFLQKMQNEGKDIERDYNIAKIEVRQYAAMKQLALKINAPTNIYDEKIKQVQCRIFGEENWDNFFGEEN